MPIVLTSPSNGQVLKFNGTNWVNDSDAGITGSGDAGQVAYFTSATTQSGSYNLFWDNTNNRLGIGTNAPSEMLHLSGNNNGITSDSPIATIRLEDKDASVANNQPIGKIQFWANDATVPLVGEAAYILAKSAGSSGGGFLTFGTSNASTLASERVRIFATGNFGINTGATDTGQRLQVIGTSYFSDSVGIGSTNITGQTLRVAKNITGGTTAIAINSNGQVQSDVTTLAASYYSAIGTQATTFTLTELSHYQAVQGTFGAGSTVTNQYGFYVQNNLTGATNNFGFFGNIAAGTGRWCLYMNGTANNYMAGSLGIGSNDLAGYGLRISKNITGASISVGVLQNGLVQSDSLTGAYGFRNILGTQAASFTLGFYAHYYSRSIALGAGSAVTNQYGFYAESSLTTATNNYGFYGELAAATGRWNLYMNGTANNYMAGSLGIGSTSLTGYNLRINKLVTGATSAFNTYIQGAVQSDVIGAAYGVVNVASTQAASFTLPVYYHFLATQSTIGAGSAITTQYGYVVDNTLTGATNNYGFAGGLAAATGRWNLYMNGTALNYLNGNLLIGSTTDTTEKLQVTGTAKITGNVQVGSKFGVGTTATAFAYINGGNAVNAIQVSANGRAAINFEDTSSINQYLNIGVQGSSAYIEAIYSTCPTINYNAATRHVFITNSAERMRLDASGNLGIGNTPTAALDVKASTTTAAAMRLRSGTAPTTPNDGDIWFDGTDLKMRIGGVTKTFTLV
jgi:hypothetical protein